LTRLIAVLISAMASLKDGAAVLTAATYSGVAETASR